MERGPEMCGIAGFFGRPDRSVPDLLLRRMIAAVSHRGPDEQGFFLDEHAGLGHARLSIIDAAGGKQPMANADRSVIAVLNGEIFNYVELRHELIAKGHRFRTNSDTEVVLKLYEKMGSDCVEQFNGDFALALWDTRSRRQLARDRMGVRPLYYARAGGSLWFASEVKALLAAPGISAALDPIALDQIFTLWFPLAPRTVFRDVCELPPGHVLLADAQSVTVRRYWRLEFPEASDEPAFDPRSETEIAEHLGALLLDATRLRLRSDLPVGAYLSGGLDSAIVAAAVHRLAPGRLGTFSLTFEDPEFDESLHQQHIARVLGTQHRSIRCGAADVAQVFPEVIRHTERPVLRTAPAPLFVLSDFVRRHGFKVVMTGEGADEVFAGYDIFKEAKLRRFCAREPRSRRRPLLLRRLYPYLPGVRDQPQPYLQAFFGAGLDEMDDPLFSHLPRLRTTAAAKQFFSAELRSQIGDYDALAELRASLPADFGRWDPLAQAQYLETTHLLPGYILSSQGDRVAMAHAVEGRFPFLDHRVVELAARIPARLKLKGLREKHILRRSARSLLPEDFTERPKQPYRAPESRCFFASGSPEQPREALSRSAIAAAGYFEPTAVDKLVQKCRGQGLLGFRDNAAFVGILSTQLWHRTFIDVHRDIPISSEADAAA
jgi:asparagine synthase (glutamine-hydrolysing)